MKTGDYIEKLRDFQKSYFSDLLKSHNGKVHKVAEHAGMTRSHVSKLLASLGLKYKDFRTLPERKAEISN